MEKIEFYERLKESIESDTFKTELQDRSIHSYKYGHIFLEKVLYFLISTRDFDNLSYFIRHIKNETFPYHYLREKKGLSEEEIEKEIYSNFIRNGYVFHTTRDSNVDQILSNGLLTLNDKYKCDVYQKCLELDKIYQNLRERNKNNPNHIFASPSLINIPGGHGFEEKRFSTIYLSSNLKYCLETYGDVGEFSGNLVEDIFAAFTTYYEYKEDNLDIKINKILDAIVKNNIDITDEELFFILEFIKTFSEGKKSKDKEKAILMIPTSCINFTSKGMKMLYTENKLNLKTEIITDFNEGEIENKGSIKKEDIIALTPTPDNTYKVKIKTI